MGLFSNSKKKEGSHTPEGYDQQVQKRSTHSPSGRHGNRDGKRHRHGAGALTFPQDMKVRHPIALVPGGKNGPWAKYSNEDEQVAAQTQCNYQNVAYTPSSNNNTSSRGKMSLTINTDTT